VSLSSVNTQTTANLYENTDFTTSLSAQRYADIPLYVNTLPYSSAPLSQPIQLWQSNVTDGYALYTQSYTSDVTFSSGLDALDRNIAYTRSSYVDNSQHLPIAVGQPGLSAFSRVDVPHSRPAIIDPTVQYAVCTSATADNVRPNVTAHPAPLQSPSIHWKKRLSYDYIPPDTATGAPTHAAPTTQSVYITPQPSDTHTHTYSTSVYLQNRSFGARQNILISAGPPRPQPPPSSYVPHSHMMHLQVPTVPSALPPPSHLPFTVPISSPSQTNTTYLHVPQTHTVFADVHAPFTHESVCASTGASIVSLQPQSTTVTAQSVCHAYTTCTKFSS